MGDLDGVNGQAHQGCRHQPRPRPQQPPTQQVDQQHGAQVEQGRQRPPHQVGLVVAGPSQGARQRLSQEQRQCAVDEERDLMVERAERRAAGIEICPQVRRRLDLRQHRAQEAFVGVLVLSLIPVQTNKAQGRS